MRTMGKKALTVLLTVLMLVQMAMPVAFAADPVSNESDVVVQSNIVKMGPILIEDSDDTVPTVTFYIGDDIYYQSNDADQFAWMDDGVYCYPPSVPDEGQYPEGAVAFRGWYLGDAADPFDFTGTPIVN